MSREKERKKENTRPREEWEDGTHAPPHRDFKERSVVLAVALPWLGVCLFVSLFAVARRFSL